MLACCGVMKHALRHFEGLKRSLRQLLSRPVYERPNFQQTGLLRQLAPARGVGSGLADEQALAVAFFGNARPRTAFLSPKEAVATAAMYARQKPDWHQALLQEAQALCHSGLPIYEATAGPLTGGLDWSALSDRRHNDRLYRLRPHRFGFLPRLAIAATQGADTLLAILATLDSWIMHVDKGDGAGDAYFSNLVVIYRVLAISWAAPFIVARANGDDKVAAEICWRLFQILAADIQHLQPRFGHSVANNHLLADRFAAWFVAASYPGVGAHADRAELDRAWLHELKRQFQDDGTNFEQSLHYHELGCEMAVAYLIVSLRIGAAVEPPALSLISQMLRFQAALADRHGNGFALGDATDDPLLPLDAGLSWGCGAWRALYRELFDPSFPATDDSAKGAERGFWLLAALRDVERPLTLASQPERIGSLAVFPVNGYAVLRDEVGEQRILLRTGPRSGASVSLGHAMSDLLSVYWNAAGGPILEASGTYSYGLVAPAARAEPSSSRDYFRSPAAHNGVVLQGHDPLGVPTGRFREGDSGARVTTHWQALDGVLGWAEGQLQEAGPLNQHRRGVLHVAGDYTLVYDLLPPLSAGTRAACHWQLAPEATVTSLRDTQAMISLPGLAAFLGASDGVATLDCVQGRKDPPAGWVSRRYGEVAPAPQLICQVEAGVRKVAFMFGLCGKDEESRHLEVLASDDACLAIDIRRGGQRDIAIMGDFAGSVVDQSCDIDVKGDALWLRWKENRCLEVRALRLRYLSCQALGVGVTGDLVAAQSGWHLLVSERSAGGFSGHWMRMDG